MSIPIVVRSFHSTTFSPTMIFQYLSLAYSIYHTYEALDSI